MSAEQKQTAGGWQPDQITQEKRKVLGLPARPLCDDCGTKPRGDIFTVCEECWNAHCRREQPLMPWEA